MALTTESTVARVRSMLAARGADVSNLRSPRILALVPDALLELATQSMPSNLLRKQFTETAAAGEASLATSITAGLLLNGIRRASIFISGFTYSAQWKADRASLVFTATTEFPWVTLENQSLIIRDAAGMDNYAGTVTIRNAPYVPTLTTIPVQLEHLFIMILADLANPAKAAA